MTKLNGFGSGVSGIIDNGMQRWGRKGKAALHCLKVRMTGCGCTSHRITQLTDVPPHRIPSIPNHAIPSHCIPPPASGTLALRSGAG